MLMWVHCHWETVFSENTNSFHISHCSLQLSSGRVNEPLHCHHSIPLLHWHQLACLCRWVNWVGIGLHLAIPFFIWTFGALPLGSTRTWLADECAIHFGGQQWTATVSSIQSVHSSLHCVSLVTNQLLISCSLVSIFQRPIYKVGFDANHLCSQFYFWDNEDLTFVCIKLLW